MLRKEDLTRRKFSDTANPHHKLEQLKGKLSSNYKLEQEIAFTANAETPDTVKATEDSIQIETKAPKHDEGMNSHCNIWQALETDQVRTLLNCNDNCKQVRLTLPIINLNLCMPGHHATIHFWSQYWKTRRIGTFEEGVSSTQELYGQEKRLMRQFLQL